MRAVVRASLPDHRARKPTRCSGCPRRGRQSRHGEGASEGRRRARPLGFTVANTSARPADYDHLKDTFRPSHADFTYEAKYGLRDVRGGGRASARETVSRVVAGAVARQILASLGVEVGAYVERVQDISMPLPPSFHSRDEVDAHPVRCPHPETAARMADRIADVKKAGDTVGGAIVLVARGVPAGWGEPVFDRLHADLAKAMWSLLATKSLELAPV